MPRFRDLSIRTKLMTGFMLTSLVALLITLGVLAAYDRMTVQRELTSDLGVLASIVGENAASSIVFNDHETARSILGGLRTQPHIVGATILDRDHKPFAVYQRSDAKHFDGATLRIERPIRFNNAQVGSVAMISDLGELQERRTRYLQLAAFVLAAAIVVALILSAIFQRKISRPILRLLALEKRVSREKNYELVATKESDDEIGRLIDGFNEMLGEIRARDAEIFERHKQEMALARSIQTSVLPRRFDFPGFDVGAVMMPAEEVGGDFYEFRPTPDGAAWIGVGDVTGHGVTSGLIMMMAQSMFTMACEQGNGMLTPARLIGLLNRSMYYNLKSRLADDRFMTMVVAKLHRDGRMLFAGAHTDILVWRAASREVERVETDGFWLGVTEKIEDVTSDRTLNLARGDVALFHTDGVTEACNAGGEYFEVDRLSRQLEELHERPAGEIVTTIANAAWRWAGIPNDDVSLLAVKRS